VYANAAKNLNSKPKHVRIGLQMLLLLDGLEDQRPLSWLESAFRSLVKSHLTSLLESKRTYWKQRNTVRWVTLGDENTSFFHTMATISHKKNFIISIRNTEGIYFTEHEQKANLLWEAYKQRLGCSEHTNMAYNLSSILTEHDLAHLDSEFSEQEIECVIKSLPNNHAPGPDGFNGFFAKKCWNIVKGDFLRLFKDFHTSNVDLRSINTSLIALIPKKDNPETRDDFRPISLLN
jgi:hypothetical protein